MDWDENVGLFKYTLRTCYHPAVDTVPHVLGFACMTQIVELEDCA